MYVCVSADQTTLLCYQLKDMKLKESNRLGKDKGSAEMKDSREKEFYASIFAGQKHSLAEQVRNQTCYGKI